MDESEMDYEAIFNIEELHDRELLKMEMKESEVHYETISNIETMHDRKVPGSPVYNYMNSLSPLELAKRVVSTQTLNSLDPLPCWLLKDQIEDHPSLSTAATDIYQTLDDNLANIAFVTRNPSEKMDDGMQTWNSLFPLPIDTSNQPPPCIEHQIEDHPFVSIDTHICQTQDDNLANGSFVARSPNEKMNDELAYVTHRGTRKCCLRCNMASAQRNNSSCFCSNINSCKPKCDKMIADSEKSLRPVTHTSVSLQIIQECQSIINSLNPQKPIKCVPSTQPLNSLCPIPACLSDSEHQIEGHPSVSTAATHILQTQDGNFANVAFMARNPSEKRVDKRRSLDFDMAGARWNNSNNHVPNIKLSTPKYNEMNVDNEKSLLPMSHTFGALETFQGVKSTMNEVMSPNISSFPSWLHLLESKKSHLLKVLDALEGRHLEPTKNKVQPTEDCPKSSPINPKKRSYESVHGGEGRACKGCNCKKSECLKLYCECFSAGIYCTGPCACQGCLNKPVNEHNVIEARKRIELRDPLAFLPKVIGNSHSKDGPNKAPAPTRHNKGCNCKKSNCRQKHCECYKSGVGCSSSCRCEECKNEFGRRYVSVLVETRSEAEEAEAREKIVVENLAIQNIEEHPDLVLPTSLTNLQIITSGLHVRQFDEASQTIPDATCNNSSLNGGSMV